MSVDGEVGGNDFDCHLFFHTKIELRTTTPHAYSTEEHYQETHKSMDTWYDNEHCAYMKIQKGLSARLITIQGESPGQQFPFYLRLQVSKRSFSFPKFLAHLLRMQLRYVYLLDGYRIGSGPLTNTTQDRQKHRSYTLRIYKLPVQNGAQHALPSLEHLLPVSLKSGAEQVI